MTELKPPRRYLRSIRAALAGIVTAILLTVATDALLHRLGILPPLGTPTSDKLLGWATVYRTVYSVLGSYIVARFAPDRPMWHAMVVGFIGLGVNLAGTIATWNAGPAFAAHWYPVTLTVLALPSAWLGAKLFLLRQPAPATRISGN